MQMAGVIFVLLGLGGVALLVLLLGARGKGEDAQVRREKALAELLKRREHLRRVRPDLIDSEAPEPSPQEMHEAVEDLGRRDPRKAAGTLRELMRD